MASAWRSYVGRVFKAFSAILILVFSAKVYAKLDLEDIVKPDAARYLKLSPSGKYLAFVFNRKGDEVLSILNADDRSLVNSFSLSGRNTTVADFYWINDERIVYSMAMSTDWDNSKYSTGDFYAINIDGSNKESLVGFHNAESQVGSLVKKKGIDRGSFVYVGPSKDEKHVYFLFYPWREIAGYLVINESANTELYKVNTYTGRRNKVESLPIRLGDVVLDNAEQARFSYGLNEAKEWQLFEKDQQQGQWQPVTDEKLTEIDFSPVSFHKDNRTVYGYGDDARGIRTLYAYDTANNKLEPLVSGNDSDLLDFVSSGETHHPEYAELMTGMPQRIYIDNKAYESGLINQFEQMLKGYHVRIVSRNKSNDRYVMLAESDRDAGLYLYFDKNKKKASPLIKKRAWLKKEQLASMQAIQFKARDGYVLNGYLTLPNGKKAEQLPLVVLPHGGPRARDYWGFNEEVQALASAGYAVLQVNFRGSSGYGREHMHAGDQQWGGIVQDDITDGVRFLIQQGVVAANRICIYGHSFGGYSALMSAAKEPDLYRCAIGSMGVYDLELMFEQGDIASREYGINYLHEALGTDKQKLTAYSPVKLAQNIKAAVMLIHGGQDRRAPVVHSEAMQQALEKAGKSVTTLLLEEEGHGYYDPQNRLKVYQSVIEFLDKHIGRDAKIAAN